MLYAHAHSCSTFSSSLPCTCVQLNVPNIVSSPLCRNVYSDLLEMLKLLSQLKRVNQNVKSSGKKILEVHNMYLCVLKVCTCGIHSTSEFVLFYKVHVCTYFALTYVLIPACMKSY